MVKGILLLLLISFQANAGVQSFGVLPSNIELKKETQRGGEYTVISVKGLQNSRFLGEPSLPVESFLLSGTPQDLQVQADVIENFERLQVKPAPTQPEACRCAVAEPKQFHLNARSYLQERPIVSMEYLGSWRGHPITRVDIAMAKYNAQKNSTVFYKQVRVQHNSQEFSMPREDYKDYLIVVPEAMADGVSDFAAWKTAQGYNVVVEAVKTPQITTNGLSQLIAQHYKAGADFVLMVGDENVLPMFTLSTSGGKTTTDLKYFTLDGSGDNVPDVFYGRIPAVSSAETQVHLAKVIEFEKKGTKTATGIKKIIGIASDEGSNPSDNEYIQTIENSFVTTFGYKNEHFYQKDSHSNPQDVNLQIDSGTAWMFYVGHGTGFSWPSMDQEYETRDMAGIQNQDQVRPIIIDVACANGRLLPGYFGTSFTDTLSSLAHGAAAYMGGTVNISWHPPAIMARGIASEHAKKNFKHLGEAILAGQLYLAANWSSKKDVLDNYTWYHLQGDPAMLIQE